MTGDANRGAAAPESAPTVVGRLRARTAAVERVIALGVVVLVVRAFLDALLVFRVYGPLLGRVHLGNGVGAQILSGLLTDASLLVVLPALA